MSSYLDDNFNKACLKEATKKVERFGIGQKEKDVNYFKKLERRDNLQAINKIGSNFNALKFKDNAHI